MLYAGKFAVGKFASDATLRKKHISQFPEFWVIGFALCLLLLLLRVVMGGNGDLATAGLMNFQLPLGENLKHLSTSREAINETWVSDKCQREYLLGHVGLMVVGLMCRFYCSEIALPRRV